MMLMRTAKSCRSGAPMPASSLREDAQATVSNKHGHRGEREVSRKTIARGMPGRSGVTVVTTPVCLFFIHTRLRARWAPGIPCALYSQSGETFLQTSDASRRGNAESHVKLAAVIASEAKQSILRHSGMVRRTRPQMRNCASGNNEIPGSRFARPGMTGTIGDPLAPIARTLPHRN